ncbi:hypothetical protein HJC23_012479 [Cyclotella cryptica]|uniref:Bromo domain-containing protein n=1 Tax=Cyclotella cryptica TaxID=29204 RepID=A0ABD3PCG1_9STRA
MTDASAFSEVATESQTISIAAKLEDSKEAVVAANAAATSAASEQHRHIQHQLESLLADLQQREPLDPTYDSLLPAPFRKSVKSSLNVIKSQIKSDGEGAAHVNKKSNAVTADVKLHRRLNANLRTTVESYASTPAGWRRRPNTRRIEIDFGASNTTGSAAASSKNEEIDAKLRAAFALRESKEHEQRDLVNAFLKAENAKLRRGWGLSQVTSAGGGLVGAAGGQMFAPGLPPLEEASARKKRLESISKQLRDVEKGAADRMKLKRIAERGGICNEALKRKRMESELERQQKIDEAKKREKRLRERLEREEAENKLRIEKERAEQERRERAMETPKDALHRLYKPIFDSLWDMEFECLGGVNPFRTVIDAQNCAAMGAPDYCEVIKKPMNLTYIQTKVNNKSYETLQEFLEDVDLIVRNALLYNHHPDSPYNIAAKAFRKQFKKLAKPLVQSLTKGITATNKE